MAIGIIVFTISSSYGASSPYDVESYVKSGWNSNYGTKTYTYESGKKLVYDVYGSKYTSGGYKVVTKDFGKGSQPYLSFQGWSVLYGHKRHTSSNHETYIVARKAKGDSGVGTTYVYGTLPINLSATEELEYNNQGSGVWNECPSGATNKHVEDCNMRYDNVGFNAYLPLQDLFPNKQEAAEWDLFIVKRVDSHIVYTQLILPFKFSNKSYNGGTLDLTSGINATNVSMISDGVIRRKKPRSTEGSGYTLGYFTKNKTYKTVSYDEAGTAVWYGVESPHDSYQTRWTNTAYWRFAGDPAVINYTPPPDTDPPTHIAHGLYNYRYKNGNDYWYQPNDQAYVRLRQHDETGNLYQYLSLYGSSQDARSQHDFNKSSTHNNHFYTSSHVAINSANREENTKYGKVKWGVVPKTHGHSYNVQYYYRDTENNTVGYNDTYMNIRVDGVAPSHSASNVYNARYINGDDYWVRPNDQVYVRLRQYDPHSGNRFQYLRLGGSGVDARSQHNFFESSTHNNHWITSSHVSINSADREENTSYGKIKWGIVPKTHGHAYNIEYYFRDNADNVVGYNTTGKVLRVDGVSPGNVQETVTNYRYQDGNTYWIRPNEQVNVQIRGNDSDSGLKESSLSLGSGSDREVADHLWSGTSTNFTFLMNNLSTFDIVSADRTYSSGGTKEVTFGVKGKTHGATTFIRHRYIDNVDNVSSGDAYGWSSIEQYLGVDGVAPSTSFSPNSKSWTNSNISVDVNLSDSHSGVKRFRYRIYSNGSWGSYSSWITGTSTDVTLSTEGQNRIHIQSEDNVGNTSDTYSGYYYIDKVNPNGTFSPNSKSWTNSNITVGLDVSDSRSGIKQFRYRTYSNGTWSSYSSWITGTSTDITLSTEGQNRIHIQSEDKAGNIGNDYSGYYYIDKVNPNGTFSPNSKSWTNSNITVGLDVSDSRSGIKQFRYRTYSNGTWSSYSSWITGTSTDITLSTEGQNRIHIQSEDKA
ncbi:hypothetical protein, partial [Alkalihalobacillus sp. BA299]|uniref:hypothetical protein n=1 Tax=Alkalihalobacillus sp. BA299 TaxID=2815938 RepID=UPI001ADAA0E7